MKNSFNESWSDWQSQYNRNRIKYNADVWSNIVLHPLDKLLDDFAQLYFDGSKDTKSSMEKYVQNNPSLLWEVVLYVRRVGLRLTSEKNRDDLVHKALELSFLVSKFEDPRDILVSLILLNFGAKKLGIGIEKWFEKINPSAIFSEDSILYQATHQTEKSIAITIDMFGPPGWKK
jgi:hypothetical protein